MIGKNCLQEQDKTSSQFNLFEGIIKREKKIKSLIWRKLLSFLYAIQLHCLFDEIRIIVVPLTIAIFHLCLPPKMRLSVDLEGLLEDNIWKQNRILHLLTSLLSIILNKLPCMKLRKERIWQIQPWNTWEKQVQSGAKEVFPPPWWILDSNGISPMLGHLYNTSWLQVCTLWTINDVSGKDPRRGLQGSEGFFQCLLHSVWLRCEIPELRWH